MEQQVEKLFGNTVLKEAAVRFGLEPEPVRKLGDFENYVFELKSKRGEPVILRLTHSSHRSEGMIAAELDWIYFLLNERMIIPRCYESLQEKRTERIVVGDSYFTAALFQKAAGKQPDFRNPEEWNLQLFQEWGRITGQMHHVTSRYKVADGILKRPQWYEDDLLMEAQAYVNGQEPFILQRLEEITAYLHGLPQGNTNFGLIHTDIHPRNFFIEDGRIMVFDFDDCAYNWFIHDIAIPLYYSLSWAVPEFYRGDRKAFAADFTVAFWRGYRQEHDLDPEWFQALPYFLKLRDLTLYLVINKKVEPHAMDNRTRNWMEEIKSRLKQNVPIVELDYSKLLEV